MNNLGRWFGIRYKLLLQISIASIATLIMLALYIFSTRFSTINLLLIPVMIILTLIAFSTFWRGILTIFTTILGITCITGAFVVISYALDNNMLTQRLINDSIKLFVIGLGIMIISVIMTFKPELLYAKNRPKEIKPMIWNSKITSKPLIPIKSLLYKNELYMLSNYLYIIASIDDKIYLVPTNEYVPIDCLILRKQDYFIGIKKN